MIESKTVEEPTPPVDQVEETHLIEEEVEEEDQKIEALEKACTIQNIVDRKTPEPEEDKHEDPVRGGETNTTSDAEVPKDCSGVNSTEEKDIDLNEKGGEGNEDEMEVEKENHDPAKDVSVEKETSGDVQEELSEADKAVASIMNGSCEPISNATNCMESETFISSSPPHVEVPEVPECKGGDGRVDEAYQEEVTKAVESIWGGTEEREPTIVEDSRPSVILEEPKVLSPPAAPIPSSPLPSSPLPNSLPSSPVPSSPLSATPLSNTLPTTPVPTSPLSSSPIRCSVSPVIPPSSPLRPDSEVPPPTPEQARSPSPSPPQSPIPSSPPPAPAPPSPTSPSPVPSPLPPESLEPPCAPAPPTPTSPTSPSSPVAPSPLGSPTSVRSPVTPTPEVPVGEMPSSSPPQTMALEADDDDDDDESMCHLPPVGPATPISETPVLSVSSHPNQEVEPNDDKHCDSLIEDLQNHQQQQQQEELAHQPDDCLQDKDSQVHTPGSVGGGDETTATTVVGDSVPAGVPAISDTLNAAGHQEEDLASQVEQTYEPVDAPKVDNHPTGQEAAHTHDLTLDVGDGPKVVNSSAGNTPPSTCGSTNTTSVITRQAPTPTPPHQQEVGSMGVFTPDSTTNSVHSMHGYSQGEFDVSQLAIESPTSISSNEMAHSVEGPQQASTPQSYNDCAQITSQQVQPPTPTHVQPTTPTHVQPTTPTHVQPLTPTHTHPTTPTPPHIARTTPTPSPILPQPISQPQHQVASQTIVTQASIQTIPTIGVVTGPQPQSHHAPTKQPSKQRHIQPKPPVPPQSQSSVSGSRPPSNLGTQLSPQSVAAMHASSSAHMMTQRMMASTPHPPSGLGQHHPMSHHHGAHTPHPPRTPHVTHTHPQMQNFSHPNYMMGAHQQMLGHHGPMISQAYLTQPSVNTYAQAHTPAHSSSYMTSVIQSRMAGAQQGSSQTSSSASSSSSSTSTSQRASHSSGSSNSCGPTTGNYFLNSSPPGPSPTPTPVASGQHHVGGVQGSASSCSIARLQQLTNGIMDIAPPPPPCGGVTSPPPHTPPPSHTVTPPPTAAAAAAAAAQRNMTPPISNLQSQMPLPYKYKSHHGAAAAAAQMPSNMMSPAMLGYQVNGYRMTGQPGAMSALNTSYLTNAPFMNQQLPMQMMNMHPQAASQYQDPRSQPQNTMYPPYSYMSTLQLNGSMRR